MITNPSINQAIDYILSHMNEPISVEDIASHCNFSRFYFSRSFKKETGEGVYEFIRRVKMEQSAFRLKVEKNRSITDVGLDYGYSSSNYSSAFKKHLARSPIEFRRGILEKSSANPIFRDADVCFRSFEELSRKISIECFEDLPVIFERHKGRYSDLSKHWGAFQEKYRGCITPQTLFLERTYDDPSITRRDACLYDLYMTVPERYHASNNTCVIAGGKFAVYPFQGPVNQIYTAYQNLFHVWLPESGYGIDDRYGFELYRKIDCGSMVMEIDLYIPVK